MRTLVALLALCACKQSAPQPAASGSGSAGSAVVVVAADAALVQQPVELLHKYLSTIEVSSHVMNRTIKPEHLVDRDFNTAWNSKTGELVGAWIHVRTWGAQMQDVRLTVGHTGKGPKGEDYFTMNPRITQVTILDADKRVVTVTLDPDNRELQRIALPRPMTSLEIRVDAVVMGTKKTWKEVCVSELEAWGLPDANAIAVTLPPVVSVFEPTPPIPPGFVNGKPVDTEATCDSLTKPLQEAFDKRNVHRTGQYEDEDAPPSCGVDGLMKADEGPWGGVARWRMMDNMAHGPGTCDLIAFTTAGSFTIGDERKCGPWDDENLDLDSAHTEDVIPGDPVELVVTYRTLRRDVPIEMIVCKFVDDKSVQCAKPFVVANDGWEVAAHFANGKVTFAAKSGTPPPTALGERTLEF